MSGVLVDPNDLAEIGRTVRMVLARQPGRDRPVPPAAETFINPPGSGWSGVVIFRNLAGFRALPVGTPTEFIRVHVNDNATGAAGTVTYDDGTLLENWGDSSGFQVYRISELPPGALYVG